MDLVVNNSPQGERTRKLLSVCVFLSCQLCFLQSQTTSDSKNNISNVTQKATKSLAQYYHSNDGNPYKKREGVAVTPWTTNETPVSENPNSTDGATSLFPCPLECYCSKRLYSISEQRLLFTTDCSNLGLYNIPQDIWIQTEVVFLDRNNLEPHILSHVPRLCELTLLDLSHNNLYLIRPFFTACPRNLLSLSLGSNHLQYLQDNSFITWPNLQHLCLTKNGLEIIDAGAFYGLHRLTDLDLSFNQLFTPDPGWFKDLSSLQKLNISNNNLHFIQNKVFTELTKLQMLDLSSNHLQHIYQQAFHGLTSLRRLQLQTNHISKLPPGSLKVFRHIDLIDLSDNYFNNLQPGDFNHVNVVHLKLNYNNVLHIIDEESFINMPLLQKLEIQNNRNLVYVDRRAFVNVKQLESLLFSSNGLVGMDQNVISSLPSLKELLLGDNPWSCDCRLEWINDILSLNNVTVLDRDQSKCAQPAGKAGCLIPSSITCDSNFSDYNLKGGEPITRAHHSNLLQSVDRSNNCLPGIITLFESELHTYIGEEVLLGCRAYGDPKPKIEWLISSPTKTRSLSYVDLDEGNSNERVNVHKGGSLHIEYVTHQDVANYTCKVTSSSGFTQQMVMLSIKNVLTHVLISRVTDESVTVTWKADTHAHGYQLLYRSGVNTNSTYHKIEILPYMRYYTVSNLLPKTTYQFCIAVKHTVTSLLISCNVTVTLTSGYPRAAVHDATIFIIGGATACLIGFTLLMCFGSYVARSYNRRRRIRDGRYGDDSGLFLADSVSELSAMTFENRFALMFDDSDIEEIHLSAAEASASLGIRSQDSVS